MRVACERPDQPEVVLLIAELDAYEQPLYPPESHHGIDFEALSQANVVFVVARDEEGMAIGCGAIVVGPEYGEIKRMFVRPKHRGQGVAKSVLALLEGQASAKGCRLFTLETGINQPEALALYERAGYIRRSPFGNYAPDQFSVFMSKRNEG